jgi:hypothetical protein
MAMATTIRPVQYFYTTVKDMPGAALTFLSHLAGEGVNLVAFSAVPLGPESAQFTLFPEEGDSLLRASHRAGFTLDGPHTALLIQGDDKLGALAEIHSALYRVQVNVYAATCVTDGKGDYGYVVYLRPSDVETALRALDAR